LCHLPHGAVTDGNIGIAGFVDVTGIEQHRRFCGKLTVTDTQCVVAENDEDLLSEHILSLVNFRLRQIKDTQLM